MYPKHKIRSHIATAFNCIMVLSLLLQTIVPTVAHAAPLPVVHEAATSSPNEAETAAVPADILEAAPEAATEAPAESALEAPALAAEASAAAAPSALTSTNIPGGPNDPNVALSHGKAGFSIPLGSVSDNGSPGYTLSASYTSNVEDNVKIWNREFQAGDVGLGWSIPKARIVRFTNDTGNTNDDTFFYTDEHGSSMSELVFVSHDAANNTKTYRLKGQYTPGLTIQHHTAYNLAANMNSFWEITKPSGMKYIYGGNDGKEPTTTSSEYQAVCGTIRSFASDTRVADCASGPVELGVRWGNWIGPSYNATNQEQFETVWHLAAIEDVLGNKTTFSYAQYIQNVGDNSAAKHFGKWSYLYRIQTHAGNKLVLTYDAKAKGDTVGGTLTANFTEFVDPWTINNEPDGYQERYSVLYLNGVEYHTPTQPTSRMAIASDFLTVDGEAEMAKRVLRRITPQTREGANWVDASPPHQFTYWGEDAEGGDDGVSVEINSTAHLFNSSNGALYGALRRYTLPAGGYRSYTYQENTLAGGRHHTVSAFRGTDTKFPLFGPGYTLIVGKEQNTNNLRIDSYRWTQRGWKSQTIYTGGAYPVNYNPFKMISMQADFITFLKEDFRTVQVVRNNPVNETWSSAQTLLTLPFLASDIVEIATNRDSIGILYPQITHGVDVFQEEMYGPQIGSPPVTTCVRMIDGSRQCPTEPLSTHILVGRAPNRPAQIDTYVYDTADQAHSWTQRAHDTLITGHEASQHFYVAGVGTVHDQIVFGAGWGNERIRFGDPSERWDNFLTNLQSEVQGMMSVKGYFRDDQSRAWSASDTVTYVTDGFCSSYVVSHGISTLSAHDPNEGVRCAIFAQNRFLQTVSIESSGTFLEVAVNDVPLKWNAQHDHYTYNRLVGMLQVDSAAHTLTPVAIPAYSTNVIPSLYNFLPDVYGVHDAYRNPGHIPAHGSFYGPSSTFGTVTPQGFVGASYAELPDMIQSPGGRPPTGVAVHDFDAYVGNCLFLSYDGENMQSGRVLNNPTQSTAGLTISQSHGAPAYTASDTRLQSVVYTRHDAPHPVLKCGSAQVFAEPGIIAFQNQANANRYYRFNPQQNTYQSLTNQPGQSQPTSPKRFKCFKQGRSGHGHYRSDRLDYHRYRTCVSRWFYLCGARISDGPHSLCRQYCHISSFHGCSTCYRGGL